MKRFNRKEDYIASISHYPYQIFSRKREEEVKDLEKPKSFTNCHKLESSKTG